ncbi:MAG: radical SAM protein [Deltaproteobacteria bacterium]|nr:MAG: radical SAM protein [Deltaproteobacteria bacterium]
MPAAAYPGTPAPVRRPARFARPVRGVASNDPRRDLAGVRAMSPTPPRAAADVTAALDQAVAYHDRLRAELPALDAALEALPAPKGLMAPWKHFLRHIGEHLDEEEQGLFPALRALADGRTPDTDFVGPLQVMDFELAEVQIIADALRNAARDAGEHEPRLLALLDGLEEHARLEQEVLRPLAMQALDAWAAAARPDDGEQSSQAPARPLRRTRGRCNTCLRDVPAEVVRDATEVRLEKHCPEHGTTTQLLSRAPDYWEELDRFYFTVNHEEFPQRDYIVRMTERCNLDCPICLAKANTEDTADLDLSGLQALLSERRGIKIDLMAAEPTLREDLEDWIRRVKASGNIAALHTNGLKLANREYARRIKEAGVDEVFVQFDGFDDDAHKVLRGRPLVKARLAAMKNLRELNIATSLIVVIARGLNEQEVARTYRYALRPDNDHIREVFFLGLRLLGSARDALRTGRSAKGVAGERVSDMAMMPDEMIDLLCAQEPGIRREDIRAFNKLYFSMLSAFRVKKCLYVQHYMVARDRRPPALPDDVLVPDRAFGTPIAELLDLPGLERAADRYAATFQRHPQLARARLLADLARHGVTRDTMRMFADLVRLQNLFRAGMNLKKVPRRFLILGFITACDPHNFDSQVAINCGKGELSVDGGFVDSGAVANVRREARFDRSDRRPGKAWTGG